MENIVTNTENPGKNFIGFRWEFNLLNVKIQYTNFPPNEEFEIAQSKYANKLRREK